MIIDYIVYPLLLVRAAYIDYKEYRIPNMICLSIVLLACLCSDFSIFQSTYSVVVMILILILAKVVKMNMGNGDRKYILANAFYLKEDAILGLLIAFILVYVVAKVKKKSGESKIPFAPYLGVGFLMVHIVLLL